MSARGAVAGLQYAELRSTARCASTERRRFIRQEKRQLTRRANRMNHSVQNRIMKTQTSRENSKETTAQGTESEQFPRQLFLQQNRAEAGSRGGASWRFQRDSSAYRARSPNIVRSLVAATARNPGGFQARYLTVLRVSYVAMLVVGKLRLGQSKSQTQLRPWCPRSSDPAVRSGRKT